ncbi:recombination-associated protein RdgC [Lysobacteraceae bacterium NML75-0749]|nr:recombination-associated protein RdgC [Xanthomonadaceae bacterium NML75-0749]PJK03661.1 recombination-associated protein RdgC [Xanthomonadaceae bacterium NML91-0268]
MFFRNLTLFRFPTQLDFSQLETQLANVALKPVGGMELSSRGFISPFGRGEADAPLMHRIEDCIWLTLGGEDKILPGAVVNDLLQKKIAEFEQKNERRPGSKMRKQMKEDLITELLPRAFVRPSRTDAMLDLGLGVLVVDTSSRKTAETLVSQIREAMGSFPALPINAEIAPRAVMTGWIAGDALPDGLMLGDECELRDPADTGAVVKVQRMELAGEEIDTHLQAGKQVSRLALDLNGHLSFVLGEDIVVRKFKLLDGAIDQLEGSENDDMRAELDARFALMAGEFKQLFAVLESALKLSRAD